MKQILFLLKPVYKTYVWGGDRIGSTFKRTNLPARVAESWEVSDRNEAMNTILNGPFKGKTLPDVLGSLKEDLVGQGRDTSRFPLLIKIIDAKQHLSIQVHPNRFENQAEPKTECWIALAESQVLDGLKKRVSKEEIEKATLDGTLPNLLKTTHLKEFEADLIYGGMIHAILEGSLLYEVQQNSNTTFRLYDWGRMGVDGKPRPLHIQDALKVLELDPKIGGKQVPIIEKKGITTLVKSPFFLVRKLEVEDEMELACTADSFTALFIAKGSGEIFCENEAQKVTLGDSLLVAAASKKCVLKGKLTLIATSLPQEPIH